MFGGRWLRFGVSAHVIMLVFVTLLLLISDVDKAMRFALIGLLLLMLVFWKVAQLTFIAGAYEKYSALRPELSQKLQEKIKKNQLLKLMRAIMRKAGL